MTDYTWPDDLVPYAASFYLQPHTGGSESPFSRQAKIYGLSAPRWVCSMRLRAPDSADRWGSDKASWGERLDAFLATLEGRRHRVRLWDFRRPGRSPTFGNSAGSLGDTTITLTGASVGEIRVGEYFGGDGRPHIITALDVSGSDLVATFKPALQDSIPANGATFTNVSGTFRLSSDDAGDNLSQVGGLTEYSLEFVEDVGPEDLPTGIIALPAVFNNSLSAVPFSNGSTITFEQTPYELVDFETGGTNQYYVSWATGTDSGAGTSAGAPWKTLTYAFAHASSPAVVNLLDDEIGVGSWNPGSSPLIFSGKIKVKGKATRTLFHGRREVEDVSTFAWAASGSAGAFVTTASRAAGIFRAHFDGNYRDGKGIPTPLTLASSIANCQATAGTFFWNSGTSSLYVHMSDNRIPGPDDGWIYHEALNYYEFQQTATTSAGVMLFENLEFMANTGTQDTIGCFRYRPVTTGSANTARGGTKNCLFYGGSGAGFQAYDPDIWANENSHAAYNHADGFNDHSFVTTGTKGEFITIYENRCSSHDNGYDHFADQAALGASSNCTSAHDSMHILRANGDYHGSNGAVVPDVNGVVSVGLICSAKTPTGTASPKACFWHSGTGAGAHFGMYLWGCTATDGGDSSIILLDSSGTPNGEANGQIFLQSWRGQTTGTVVGTLKDWAGNTLASLADAT